MHAVGAPVYFVSTLLEIQQELIIDPRYNAAVLKVSTLLEIQHGKPRLLQDGYVVLYAEFQPFLRFNRP